MRRVVSNMRKLSDKYHIFYGWIIVVFGLITTAMAYGIGHNCFSLYIKPVCEAFGFSRKGFSTCLSIQYGLYMLISLFSGKLFKKFSVMRLMRIAAILLPISYFCMSFAESLPLFYGLSVLVGLFIPLLSFQAFAIVITNWFEERRGTATGITFMGSGLGGMLFNALAGRWVVNLGFTTTYRILAVCMAVVIIPVVFLVLKERPEDLGLLPYGVKPAGSEEAEAGAKTEKAIYGLTVKEAFGNINMWLLFLLVILIGFSTAALANNIVPHLSDVGFSATYAAAINAAYLGSVSAAKILQGVMFDKFGMKKAMYISMAFLLIGFLGILLAKNQIMHLLIVTGAALGCASGTIAYPLLTLSVCGTKDYPTLNGIVMAVASLGSTLSPFINNAIYDAKGSYNIAFISSAGMAVIAMVLTAVIRTVKKDAA